MHTPPAAAARHPAKWLALVSVVTALVTPVALLLTVGLYQLAFAVWCPQGGVAGCPPLPPLGLLVMGLVGAIEEHILLTLPTAVVAIITGHLAAGRMRHHSVPNSWRRGARWGLILGYGTPVFLVAYAGWLLLTGQFGGE
jgi:hypothetical protein